MLHKCSTWKVARVFFNEPTEDHYLKEISRKAGLSHTSVKKHLQELQQMGIIETEEERRGKRSYPIYRSMVEERVYKNLKKIDVLHRLETSELLDHLEQKFSPNCIVLFGSASRGEDVEESDVDLFLEADENQVDLSEYEDVLNREIQLHLNPDFTNYPQELKNNIINGTLLRGFLEAFK